MLGVLERECVCVRERGGEGIEEGGREGVCVCDGE